jgi:DNA-directed RNA polymerase specialized sigma24 family protein
MTQERQLIVEPIINYPRQAKPGETYLLTVDLRFDADAWPYEEEEYPIHCMLDTGDLFSQEPIGDSAVILHRFGGTYGPAMYLLKANEQEQQGEIRVTLVNRWGMPFKLYQLDSMVIYQTGNLLKTEEKNLKITELDLQEDANEPQHKMDEKSAIEDMCKGGLKGLEIFYKRYAAQMLFHLERQLPRELAEEVLQKTFFYFFKNIKVFKHECGVFTWLSLIVLVTAIEHFRYREPNQFHFSFFDIKDEFDLRIANSSNLEEVLCYQMCVEKALKLFEKESPHSEEYLRVIAFKLEGCSITEIADKIGKTEKVTAAFLNAARRKFKPHLQHCLDDCKEL